MVYVYVVVRLDVEDKGIELSEVVSEMDYNMTHERIHGTEIVDMYMEDEA